MANWDGVVTGGILVVFTKGTSRKPLALATGMNALEYNFFS